MRTESKITTKHAELTDKEVATVSQIISSLGHHYDGWYQLSFDDVCSKLWIEVLRYLNKNFDLDVISNAGMIKNCMNRRALDMVRYASRQQQSLYSVPVDRLDETLLDSSTSNKLNKSEGSNEATFLNSSDDVSHDVSLMNVLSLFEKGTREYGFVRSWALHLGLADEIDGYTYHDLFGDVDPDELANGHKNGNSDHSLVARSLGFSNSSSSAYKSVKWNVYSKMCKELHYDNLRV